MIVQLGVLASTHFASGQITSKERAPLTARRSHH